MSAASSPTGAPTAHAGVLIIRAWWEPEHPVALRARITRSMSTDPESGADEHGPVTGTISVATADELLEAVRAWLDSFVRL